MKPYYQSDVLTPPFAYFGGKRHLASLVWDLIGDVDAYVEPFAGSAAVLLGRPEPVGMRREIINDLDGWITNLWRSVRDRPAEVLMHMRGPVMEIDVHARLAWLRAHGTPELISWLGGDPEHCDPKAAGWWLYATIASIAGGTNRGPWKSEDGYLRKTAGARDGIRRAIPHITRGRVFPADDDIERLSARLRHVVITCGDWTRPLSKALRHYATVGVLLDPPYESRARTADGHELYMRDSLGVSYEVREWCMNAPEGWRIVLCGYDDEHDALLDSGWRKVSPPKNSSGGGYNHSDLNSRRDRLWVSPACLGLAQQAFDLEGIA